MYVSNTRNKIPNDILIILYEIDDLGVLNLQQASNRAKILSITNIIW